LLPPRVIVWPVGALVSSLIEIESVAVFPASSLAVKVCAPGSAAPALQL
jgi:hypothetical protein